MKLDFNSLAESFDIFHGLFAGIAIIELILLVMLLSLVIIGLLRKSSTKANRTNLAEPTEDQKSTAATPAQTGSSAQSAKLKEAPPDAALQLLGLFQQEARFVDFIEEDVQSFSDAEIGAAARIVHEGCRRVLHNHFELAPVRPETENSRITVKKGFDPSSIRLIGNIVGQAPFKGTLVHRGWRVTASRLPKLAENHNVSVVSAAEVEL